MLGVLLDVAAKVKRQLDTRYVQRRWQRLRQLGMHIGEGVNLPRSTTIDASHCFLIHIGDWCGFGEECVILAHEGQMDEFLDAGRVGKVVIHEHSHIGTRSVILPGVEIGPRTIVGANSLITRSLPPDTVCAGSPAKVICSLEEYLDRHRRQMRERPTFPYERYRAPALNFERRAELVAAVQDGPAYITGGFSALLAGRSGMRTTPFGRQEDPAAASEPEHVSNVPRRHQSPPER